MMNRDDIILMTSVVHKVFLTQEALVTVVHAFVTSRIDYCNSLLYGISDYNINRLQRIQNSAALIVTNTRKYHHITPILQKLHWLPVRQRIHFQDFINNLINISMIWHQNICVNWCPLESHPENSGHPVRYYRRCQCLGSSHMVIVHLVLQPPLCEIGCPQILVMRHLLNFFNLF